MNLYADNAVLKPTFSSVMRRTPEEIRVYFVGGGKFGDVGFFKEQFCDVLFTGGSPQFFGEMAFDMGGYEFIRQDRSKVEADYTFIYQRATEGKVLIVAHHSSLKP